jgi:hypothetical protein
MSRIRATATIDTTDGRLISQILSTWLELQDDLPVRFRMFGFQLEYETDEIELYCYEATNTTYSLLEASLYGKSIKDAETSLTKLATVCQDKTINWQIEYIEEDENGTEIGEELSIELKSTLNARPA